MKPVSFLSNGSTWLSLGQVDTWVQTARHVGASGVSGASCLLETRQSYVLPGRNSTLPHVLSCG